MNINEFLLGVDRCKCGKMHKCPIKHVVIEGGALATLPDITGKYKKILLVADENTYAAASGAESFIREKIYDRVIFPGDVILVPNEDAINRIKEKINCETNLILGIGSGVINDLCKHTSFESGLPYHIVATAPSMDGYASKGAALILGGMKVTLNAAVPEAIIADTDILKNAPEEMIIAGYGDIIGKYSCLSDWKLSALVRGEYICDFVVNATYDEIEKTRRIAKLLKTRDAYAIETLMKALVSIGILMAYVGNSRPASGSEHHFSHYFEIVGILKDQKYLPHGIDVFYSAAETAKIREIICSLEKPELSSEQLLPCKYNEDISRIYGKLSDEIFELQEKVGLYSESDKRLDFYISKWNGIRSLLKEAPKFSEMDELISEVGMKYETFKQLYGDKKIQDAYLYAKDLKDRYTVLWMYYDIFVRKS